MSSELSENSMSSTLTNDEMISEIDKKLLYSVGFGRVLTWESEIQNVYNLVTNGVVEEPVSGIECNWFGMYYHNIKDHENMKKYYLMAIELGNDMAMLNLGIYYQNIKDNINMVKYYLMAIERGNDIAMCYLGLKYQEIKDYKTMEKYFIMSIERGNDSSLEYLAEHYIETYKIDNNIRQKKIIKLGKYNLFSNEFKGYFLDALIEMKDEFDHEIISILCNINLDHPLINLIQNMYKGVIHNKLS